MAPTHTDKQHSMLKELVRELFQTETSASWHCRRESRRLGDSGPARALLGIALHADRALETLPPLVKSQSLPASSAGRAVGALFSEARQRVADRFLTRERSYRATLLGVHHGVGVVTLLGELAALSGTRALSEFCRQWLDQRVPMLERAEQELVWFARHPQASMRHASDRPVEATLYGSL